MAIIASPLKIRACGERLPLAMNLPRREMLLAAEQAVGQGRLDHAVRLLASEAIQDVSGRRLAIDLHDRLSERCQKAIDSKAWKSAIEHLQWLHDLEGKSEQWFRLLENLRTETKTWAEDAMRADRLDEVELLIQSSVAAEIELPVLDQLNSVISSIRSAKKLAGLGRFAEAENCLRVPPILAEASNRIATSLVDEGSEFLRAEAKRLQDGHEKTKKLLAELHQATESKKWDLVASLSEQVLAIASRHPTALQHRQRAIAELAAQGKDTRKFMEPRNQMAIALHHQPSTHVGHSPLEKDVSAESKPKMPILWIDGVGGYALCDSIEAIIGQAIPGNPIELMIVGDLSRRAAAIRKSGEDHLLQPLQNVLVNGIKMDRAALLRDGDMIAIGPRIEMRYTRPSKLSATAKLEITSHHRWQPTVDGILLMGDTCILGPGNSSHVLCPYWSNDVILFRNRGQWMCKCSQPLEIDGKEYRDAVALVPGKRVRGPDFSLSLE